MILSMVIVQIDCNVVFVQEEVQDSVKDEKFPQLRFLLNPAYNSYFLPKIKRTNLKNLGNTTYTSLFSQIGTTVFFINGFNDKPLQNVTDETPDTSSIDFSILDEKFPFQLLYNTYYYYFDPSPNFVTLDWSAYNTDDYLAVINLIKPIANEIGDQLYEMANNRNNAVDLTTWNFVGFSLGAHMVGLIARRIKEKSNGQIVISRITGLDPAGPVLNYPVLSCFFSHLEKSDGEFQTN